MSAPSQAPVRPWWKRLLGWLHVLANLGLLAALGGQGVLLYLLWEDGELPIPGFVTKKVEQALAEQGMQVDISSMKLDLRGILLMRDVKVSLPGYHEPIAEADLILVDFPPWAALDSSFLPNEVWLSRCNLYCPTVLSPTGTREQVAEDLFTEVAIRHHRLDLDRLILRLSGLDIRAEGSVPVALIEDAMSGEKLTAEERDRKVAAGYAAFCREILKAHPWIERFTDPRLQLQLGSTEDGLKATLDFQAESFNLGQGIEGQRIVALAGAEGKDFKGMKLKQARTRVRDLAWEDKVKAKGAQIEAIIPKKGLPTACRLGAIGVEGLNLTLDTLIGVVDFAQPKQPKGWLHVQSEENWLRVDGWADGEKETLDLDVAADWDPVDLLKISLLEGKLESPPDLVCSVQPRWRGHIKMNEGYEFAFADVGVDFGKTRYETLNLESVFARARITPQLIDVRRAVLATDRYVVNGSYREELDTHRYRFLLEGNVDPMEISFLIDADWWPPLWKDFHFASQLPYSNIDLQGAYGQGDKGKTFFGYNELRDFTYQGVNVDRFTAMLWRETVRIILYDMRGRGKSGAFDAAIQFNYTPDGETRTSLGFAAATTLPLMQAASLAGEEAVGYVSDFHLTAPPRLQVNGLTVDPTDGSDDNELTLKIVADMDAETTYQDFVFDRLSFVGVKTPELLQLRKISFGMAGGTGTGQADIKVADDEKHNEMALGLSLRGASYAELQTAVPFLGKKESEAETKEASTAKPDKAEQNAVIDFDLNAQGMTGDISTFRGYGQIGVRNALLGQFHLFGGLSRGMQAIGLNLGTVDFTKGSAPFVLGKGYAHFPDVKITGPTARIDANGNLNLETNELDFYLSLYPLGGIDVPVVTQIFSVINPITDVVEARLQGNFEEPKWAVDFRPFGIITGQKKVDNPTGETMPANQQSNFLQSLE